MGSRPRTSSASRRCRRRCSTRERRASTASADRRPYRAVEVAGTPAASTSRTYSGGPGASPGDADDDDNAMTAPLSSSSDATPLPVRKSSRRGELAFRGFAMSAGLLVFVLLAAIAVFLVV